MTFPTAMSLSARMTRMFMFPFKATRRPSVPPPHGARQCFAAALLAIFAFSAQAQVASPMGGFSTLTILGTHGKSTAALSLLGLGLTRPALCHGRIDGLGPRSISDSRATWIDGQFDGLRGPHFFELTSGPYAGFTAEILDTQSASKSLILNVDLSKILDGGESFAVRPHWTLAGIFGPANEAGLGSGSAVTADEILVLNPVTRVYTTYFYKTVGLGGTGWRSTTSLSADQSNARMPLGQGILVRRKQTPDLSLRLFGAVKTGCTLLAVVPGLNIAANIVPTARTLGSSRLYTGDPRTGLAGGSIVTADKLLLFDGSIYQTYYYKTTSLGGTGWRSAASASVDASNAIIPAGAAMLIQRSTSLPAFFWSVPASDKPQP
jgi:uncharacterized protein (TIGR02597 family)